MNGTLTDLLTESRQLGFLGPGPIVDHISHAAAFAAAVAKIPARALDLGAGGGLPGLVLAATVWPHTTWSFLDAQTRRTEFLAHACGVLGLTERVQVVTARAENYGRIDGERGTYDLVVARSFAAPGVTAECAAPLLRPEGHLVVSEPPGSDVEGRWPAAGLAMLGFDPAEAVVVEGEDGDPTHLMRVRLVATPPDRYARRVGVPAKRPLF